MDDQTFARHADEALSELFDRLTEAGDQHGFDADFNSGALTIEFDEPQGKFVVSPNSPVRQIWVSANVRSYKLDWDGEQQEFVLAATGQTLDELMSEAISTHLGETVVL
ncbi:MAG: iron donor protein CyaY [Bryobacteraceae bacterium]